MYSPGMESAVNEKVLWGSYLKLHIERLHRHSTQISRNAIVLIRAYSIYTHQNKQGSALHTRSLVSI